MSEIDTLELYGTTEWNKNLQAYVWKGKVVLNGDLVETHKGSHKYTWDHCSLEEVLKYFNVGDLGKSIHVIHYKKEIENAI